jgi:hypothetical protein
MKVRQALIRRVVGMSLVLPAMAINYLVVLVLLYGFHFQGFWVLSAVAVGDIIAIVLNSSMIELNTKILMKFESFRVLVERQDKKLSDI